MDYVVLAIACGNIGYIVGGVTVYYLWNRRLKNDVATHLKKIDNLKDELESQANYKQLYESLQDSLDSLRAKYPLPKFDNHTSDEEVGV